MDRPEQDRIAPSNIFWPIEELRQRAAQIVCECGYSGADSLANVEHDLYAAVSNGAPWPSINEVKQRLLIHYKLHKSHIDWHKWKTSRFPEGAEL